MPKARGFLSLNPRKDKKGNTKYYPFYTHNGKRHRAGRGFTKKQSAEAWGAAEYRLIELGTWTPPEARRKQAEIAPLTVGQWLEQFQDIVAKKVKPSTLDTYKRVENNRILNVQPPASMAEAITRLKDIPLVELKRADVYAWWDAIEKQWPGDGRTFNHKAYVRLKAACTEAVRRELIPTNPVDIPDAAKAPKAKEKYLMENWEPRALIAAADDRVKAVTILTLHHGLRIGEALALNLEDVTITPATDDHPARAEVHITKNFQRLANETTGKMGMVLMDTPKTDAGRRTVSVLVEDVEALAECVARRKKEGAKPSDLLTVAPSGVALLDVDYRNMLNRLKAQTGVSERITPHCGRNWLITRLAEQGVTIKAIGQIMGQSDLKTITEVYMKVSPGATSEAMLNLGAVLHEQAKAEKKKKEEAKAKEGGRQ